MKPIDKTLALTYSKLPAEERSCYQPATQKTEGAVNIEGYGYFAPAAYDENNWAAIREACATWKYRLCEASGIDEDSDSGIYDVDREYWNESVLPSHCILLDGRVIGFVHRSGYFIIGSLTERCDDRSSGCVVDRTTCWLIEDK